jgi:hypothetical protein
MALRYGAFKSYEFYAPRMEAVRVNTFEQSKTYNDGMVRDLENLQMEYQKGTDTQKDALRSIILHRFSVYPEQKLPADLQLFYNQLRGTN